jgi:hypothetical protein
VVSAQPSTDPCPNCGAAILQRARFCPECGTRLEDGEHATTIAQLPPQETGPVPVSVQRAEPRWFGVTPPAMLLGLAAVVLVLAIVLFLTGHWPFGLILLGLSALLLAGFLEAARQRPQHREARLRGGSRFRERSRSTWEEWRARSTAAAEVRRLQSALLLIDSDRKRALADLGAAAHLHDSTGEAAARARLAELDQHEAALRAELDSQLRLAGERIRQAKLPVQDTMMVMPAEPTPPPGEANPPQPAVVPEAYPPPDEATPPQPARVPEPSPGGGDSDDE